MDFIVSKMSVPLAFRGSRWLINIENKVDPGHNVDTLVFFLKCLTMRLRAARQQRGCVGSETSSTCSPSAAADSTMVLWYDAVTVNGNLAWQNRLNSKNRDFFCACDGIFTNYHWKDDYPSSCALEAKGRRLHVYMGIDTFGRGTWGGGGYNVDKALGKIRRAGVSAALFAPAWTMENKTPSGGVVDPSRGQGWTRTEQNFQHVDNEFWSKIAAAWHSPRIVEGSLGPGGTGDEKLVGSPIVMNFGRGMGDRWRICGEPVAAYCVPDSKRAYRMSVRIFKTGVTSCRDRCFAANFQEYSANFPIESQTSSGPPRHLHVELWTLGIPMRRAISLVVIFETQGCYCLLRREIDRITS